MANTIHISGNLTRDANVGEPRGDNDRVPFGLTIADNTFAYSSEEGKRVEGVQFWDVLVWAAEGKQSSLYEESLVKGAKVSVTGQAILGSYTNSDDVEVPQLRCEPIMGNAGFDFVPRFRDDDDDEL